MIVISSLHKYQSSHSSYHGYHYNYTRMMFLSRNTLCVRLVTGWEYRVRGTGARQGGDLRHDGGCQPDDHDAHQERGARGDDRRGSAVFRVAVRVVRSVAVVAEAAFELHGGSVRHVGLVAEGLVRAGFHHRVCGHTRTQNGDKTGDTGTPQKKNISEWEKECERVNS